MHFKKIYTKIYLYFIYHSVYSFNKQAWPKEKYNLDRVY